MPKDLQEALQAVRKRALEMADGHFTLLAFTTEYKGCYGTPSFFGDPETVYKVIADLPGFQDPQSLLEWMAHAPKEACFFPLLEERVLAKEIFGEDPFLEEEP